MRRVILLFVAVLLASVGWSQSTSSSQQINIKYKNGNSVQIDANDIDYIEFNEVRNNPDTPTQPDIPVNPNGDMADRYLTFVAQESGTFRFNGTTNANTVQYSLDSGVTWKSLARNTDSPTVKSGNKIMWKGTLTPSTKTSYGIGKFSSTGRFTVEGNAHSLLWGDDFQEHTDLKGKNYAFHNLFKDCTGLTSAENLSLPATTLAKYCYYWMFEGCTSLTTAPSLPATTLAQDCYGFMFYCCTSLTTTPKLPATTLASSCYISMFEGCRSLTTAPVLPATTLASSCYRTMFAYCTSLTTAPSLPATTLAQDCYYCMFNFCTSLTTAPKLPATTMERSCYSSMFSNCTSLITAPELPAITLEHQCYEYMFYGCTSLITAPELPATALQANCYSYMFYGCTSLTTAPELPATTLEQECYCNMFNGCSSLNYIKCLATDISAWGCTTSWVNDVASSGTFVKNSSTDWKTKTGSSGIPYHWTVQNMQSTITYTLTITATGDGYVSYNDISVKNDTKSFSIEEGATAVVKFHPGEGYQIKSATMNGRQIADLSSMSFTIDIMDEDVTIAVEYEPINTINNNNDNDTSSNYLTFVAEESGTFKFYGYGSVKYSLDNGTTWNTLASGKDTPTVAAGNRIMWKAGLRPRGIQEDTDYGHGIGFFSSSGKFSAEGNIMSLLCNDNFADFTNLYGYDYAFNILFFNCTGLTSAENLILPATTLASYCYSNMFQGCTSLTTAPSLPATTLANNCYEYMFKGCVSLGTVPGDLLPATTLAERCYWGMFYGCRILWGPPRLPAPTLVKGCYGYMFYNTDILDFIICLATDISAENCTYDWLNGNGAVRGDFYKAPGMNDWTRSPSGIPGSWTIHDYTQ